MKRTILLAGALLAWSATLFADFSYVETTNLTGGSMAGAMKFAGKLGGGGFNNMQTHVYVSGDLLARIDERSGSIVNLKDQTVTNIDYKRGEYSVMTFAQMRQAIEQAQADARAKMEKRKNKNDADVQMTFNMDVKDPGRTAVVSGFNAKETILLITAEFADQKNGASGAMNMAANMWMSTEVPGHKELQDFSRRMSESIAWNPSSSMLAGMQQGFDMGESMAKLQEQAAKMEGVTVKQIMRIGGNSDALARLTQEDQEKVAAAQEQNGGGSGLLKGALGGFGGFGRKKDRDPEPQPSNGAATAAEAGVLMEMTTLYSDFSNSTISADKFRPDPSFTKVESKMLKQLSK
jgi:hypothetical protein